MAYVENSPEAVLGERGEQLIEEKLKQRGYTDIEPHPFKYKSGAAPIDFHCRNPKGTQIFFEVKTRAKTFRYKDKYACLPVSVDNIESYSAIQDEYEQPVFLLYVNLEEKQIFESELKFLENEIENKFRNIPLRDGELYNCYGHDLFLRFETLSDADIHFLKTGEKAQPKSKASEIKDLKSRWLDLIDKAQAKLDNSNTDENPQPLKEKVEKVMLNFSVPVELKENLDDLAHVLRSDASSVIIATLNKFVEENAEHIAAFRTLAAQPVKIPSFKRNYNEIPQF